MSLKWNRFRLNVVFTNVDKVDRHFLEEFEILHQRMASLVDTEVVRYLDVLDFIRYIGFDAWLGY